MNDHALAVLCKRAYEEMNCGPVDLEFIVESDRTINYLGIRGTEFTDRWKRGNYVDMLRNYKFIPARSKATGWAHRGYLAGAEDLYNHLQEDHHRDMLLRPWVIAGHSMGAAVGALLSQILVHYGFIVLRLVMFGSPRVYLKRPRFDFDVVHYRNGSDIVTAVHPFYELPAPFVQIGNKSKAYNVFDHQIEEYIKSLRDGDMVENSKLRGMTS